MTVVSLLKVAWRQASTRQAPLLAAGVAFYLFTSLFPAMIAAVSVYGLVADPEAISAQTKQISEALPADAASLINTQLEQLASAPASSLGFGAVLAIVLAMYAASAGIGNLVTAINQLYGLLDDRSFLQKKATALALTVGAIVFGLFAISLVAVLPAVLNAVDAVPGVRLGVQIIRWLALAGGIALAIGVLYRVAPNRHTTGTLLTKGVLTATAIWLLVSVGFSIYVDHFGSYSQTYGALAGVVVLLLWLWVGMYAILLGACVEAAREHIVTGQTLDEEVELARERTVEAGQP